MKKKIFILFVGFIFFYGCKDVVWEPIYNDKEQLEIDIKIIEDYLKSHKVEDFNLFKINNGEQSIYDELGGKLMKLENGVFYYEYRKGLGIISPINNDTILSFVKAYYEGRLVDDNIFGGIIPDEIGKDTVDSYEFFVSNLVGGWKSSLPLMKIGILDTSIVFNGVTNKNDTIVKYKGAGQSILFIPSRLGYGVDGNFPAVSFSQPLIFRVELESVANQVER